MARPKKENKEPVMTTPASVAPEFEQMIEGLAKAMERSKSWLSGRLLMRGYLAMLEGEKLLDEEATKTIISDKVRYEHIRAHAKQLLDRGVPQPETFPDFYIKSEQMAGRDVEDEKNSVVG
jgi:hypothetical protein